MNNHYNSIEKELNKPYNNHKGQSHEFDYEQQQQYFSALNEKKAKSKKENEEKAENLKLQLEIESFIDTIKNSNGIIDFDSMEQIGHGGTHNVFDPNKPGKFIVKINKTVYNESIKGNENGKLNENLKKMANGFINDRNTKFDTLYKSFGIENCLYERLKLVKIQYQGQIIECPIVIQEKSDLYGKKHLGFPATYIKDIDILDNNSYKNLNNILLKNESKNSISQEDDNFMFKFNTKLKGFIDEIQSNKNLEGKVAEFLDKIKNHYNNTGEIIDLVGKDNVMFYKEGTKRNFKIGSVIKDTSKKDIENVLTLLNNKPEIFKQGIQESEEKETYNKETRKAINDLNNILAYTRILNYLGIKLGKGKIININLSEKQIQNLNELGI